MLQPVLLVMEVRDGTEKAELGKLVAETLRNYGRLYDWHVKYAIPMSYTLDVPADVVSG